VAFDFDYFRLLVRLAPLVRILLPFRLRIGNNVAPCGTRCFLFLLLLERMKAIAYSAVGLTTAMDA
jgi:hypothetical protein